MISIELENAGVRIDGHTLVDGVTLALSGNCFTALVGPNGSGKTTLLRLMAGLLRPSVGTVRCGGLDLRAISRRELARRIAFVPQNTNLEFDFTVREIVAMGRHAHLGRFQPEGPRDRRLIEEAMERADVTRFEKRFVTELSGGERQRVIIARSLATEADTILLDEPTASLDISHALDVMALCRTLSGEGKTIVMSIHDLNAALRYAGAAALMNGGRLAAYGQPDTVLNAGSVHEVFGVTAESLIAANGRRTFVFDRA